MVYVDTSFIVPFYLYEAGSVKVVQIISALPLEDLAISDWTAVEFASVLARRLRMREISPDLSAYLLGLFELEVRNSYQMIFPSRQDYSVAMSFLRRPGLNLRAGDAFHLAIAKNHQIDMLLSLDEGMLKAASMLGIPAGKSL